MPEAEPVQRREGVAEHNAAEAAVLPSVGDSWGDPAVQAVFQHDAIACVPPFLILRYLELGEHIRFDLVAAFRRGNKSERRVGMNQGADPARLRFVERVRPVKTASLCG